MNDARRTQSAVPMDPKQIVATGYDQIAERYLTWAAGIGSEMRERYTALLWRSLARGARVLELGCGAGEPTTARLAERFAVTGVDISARQIELARERVPGATFVHADMTELTFAPDSFDAVTAFYSITHVPRPEHADLLAAIARWLRPNGLFVASMGAGASPDMIEDDWLGAPMFFSHYDSATNKRLAGAAGLDLLSAEEETDDEDGTPATFLWVVARKVKDG